MKKSLRLFITGNLQSMFFKQWVKENADKNNVKGFMRKLEDLRTEIFIEGNKEEVDAMVEICKVGPKFASIRNVVEKEERFQDFKEFKILNF